ncbi:MAG: glycoside hydrolase family 2 TIM barrel-domain containing protein [Eubacteriales bacterium]|nr:glycoside hydrolase family 2 TIM barrel-domain containing protein [Eubacteriales bacterium]
MIFDAGRKKESLDGYWNYGVDQYDTCLRAKWYEERYYDEDGRPYPMDYSFDEWPTMKLPSCFNMQREDLKLYEGSVVYTRTFYYERKKAERVFIKIGAANYTCRIFLNGRFVGMHKGGSTPFYVEVTNDLKPHNRIIITCDNKRNSLQIPMENTDWFNYGGIYRSIEIISLPQVFIKDFRISLDSSENSYTRIVSDIRLSDSIDGTAHITIPDLNVSVEVSVKDGYGHVSFEAEPELWTPDTPVCYEVMAEFGEDRIKDEVGFRRISVMGNTICLNGTPVFLKGISCHEESITNGKALTDEERMENLLLAKELGCNYMRLAHYPHHDNMARMADKLGILLWEEIPVYWAIAFDNPDTYEDAKNQLLELIKRDYNRASVIIWSVGNENADTDSRLGFMKNLVLSAKELDTTRLVSAACLVDYTRKIIADRLGDYLDIIGINEYCGWYIPDFDTLPQILENSAPDKPVIITEFGADARAGHRGTIYDKGSEDCQAEIYRKQVETLEKIPYVKGMTPWILYDFRCPRRLSVLQNYYNLKGLCSADKKYKKMAFYVLQDFYKNLK